MITSVRNKRRLTDWKYKGNKQKLLLLSAVAEQHAAFYLARIKRRPVCIHKDVEEQTVHTHRAKVQINRQLLQVARSASVLLHH